MSAPILSAELATLLAAGPVVDRTDAEFITREHFAVKRANEIRDWAPAICGLVAHILKKCAPTLQDKLLEKARSASDRRQIEVPIFTYTSTVLRVPASTEFTATASYTLEDGEIVFYTTRITAADACREHETTIASIASAAGWEGGEVPDELRHIPLRRLLAFDGHALGLLSILLGDNIKVVKRPQKAKKETDHYVVCDTVLMAKFFTVNEDQGMPLGEKLQLELARKMWLPPAPAPPAPQEDAEDGGCGYEWCDGSCGTLY